MNGEIVDIATVVLTALGLGLVFIRMGQPPIVGYIITGVILGPSCMKLIHDRDSIQILSELGIIFLLFAIGLNLSFEKVKHIWKQSLGVNIVSGGVFFSAFYVVGKVLNWDINMVVMLAFCAMCSSTAVTMTSLKRADALDSEVGDYTIGMVIIQDIVALLMVIAIKFLGTSSNPTVSGDEMQVKILLFAVLILAALFIQKHKNIINKLLVYIKSKEEILAICTIAVCLSGAVLSITAGFSPAFGSFIAGLILGNSVLKEELKSATSIMEETLLMVFFLSIGLLVDTSFLFANMFIILTYVIFIMVGKTGLSIAVLRLFKFEVKDAFFISVLLGHLGEFAFVLINEGVRNSLLDKYSTDLLINITAVSLFISPFWLVIAERCRKITDHIAVNSSLDLLKYTSHREFTLFKKLYKTLRSVVVFLYLKMVNLGKYSAELFKNHKKFRDR